MSTNNVNIVNTNNWYQKMNVNGNQNVTNMVLSGTNPSTQMTLINSANDVHYLSSNYPISSVNGFTMSFQFYISGTASNLIWLNAFFGTLDYNVNAPNINGQGGVEIIVNPGGFTYGYGNGHQLQILSIGTSGTYPVVSNNTSVTAGAWQTVSITFNPSGTTNNWVVSYNGTTVMTYNYSSNIYGNPIGQNSTWGIGATNGGTPATVFIRNVDFSVKQSMPLSVLKNTYSFYPEECFIDELSTHSQTNAAAAFGLRLLKSDYLGPIINVRRGSDNATLDFYADSKGNVGTTLYGTGTTLLGWLAGSIGYVTRWYDQSNNGRDVIQATNANQPKIGTPILDTMSSSGKSAARGVYTLYRANSTYSGATIKLRRSSDNAVSDFYADIYGNLGTSANATGTSFSSWIGSSTAYVDTWYDQSGSGNHATQSTTANQPVYNGTLKLIDSLNSSSLFLNMPSGTVPTGTLNAPYSFVFKHGTVNNNSGAFIGAGTWSNNQSNTIRAANEIAYHNYWYGNDFSLGTPSQRVTGNTVTVTYNGSLHNGYINNTLSNTNSNHTGGTTAAGQQYLFRSPGGEYLNGQMYSVFIFGAALSDADRMACTSNPTDLNIRYDGSQCLNQGTTNWPLTNGLKNYTYIFSGRIDGNNNNQSIIQMGPWNANNTGSAIYLRSNYYGFAGYGNDALDIVAYTPFVNRKCVMMCNHNLNTGNVVINDNGTIYTGTTGSPSALNLTNLYFTIGAVVNNASSAPFTGNINEIIVFRNTLTAKESMLYFTPNAITRKNYRSQPRLQIKDIPKDIGAIPSGAVVAIDTQMLSLSPGSPVTSWNGVTGLNSPVINAGISGTGNFLTIPPYVSLTNNNVSASLSTGQYLNAGSKTFNINTNGGFTAIWYGAFTGSANNYERIFDFGSGTSNNVFVMREATSSRIVFYLNNESTAYSVLSGNGMITQNEWAVWTFRYTASSRLMEIIKNGILYSTGTAGAAITDRTLSNTWIGRSNWTADAYSSINMAGLYVYASFLTDAQVASVSNHLMYPTTTSMPSTLTDSNNKVVRFGSVLSQGFRNGQAMFFNGNLGSYLDIQDVPNWPLTFCFWFNISNNIGTNSGLTLAALCSQDGAGNGSSGWGIQVDTSGNGTNFCPYYSTTGNTFTAMTTQTIALNTWYHIAFTVTPTTLAYYLNGTLVQSVSAVIYNTNRLVIGKSGDNARPFNGYIADVRVFDYALRADEISSISGYAGQAGQEIMNYNTPTNYLVNSSNWYNSSLTTYQTGSFGIAYGGGGADFYIRLTGNGVANSSNTVFNSTRIQNYNSFTCSFLAYIDTGTDHGYYFYCGATSSTTVPTGTAGTSANSSYYIYFQITGTRGIYLYNDQGQQLAYSLLPQSINNSVYVPITISYNRSTTNTWTVNVASNDILTFSDPNNTNWVSNIAGDFWGIGARTTTSGMNMYIRRVELSYTPFINSINSTVNAQNNTKFPPGAMTANTTTFTGTGILDGVYTATQSNPGEPSYYAFDNSNNHAGEVNAYNYTTGNYTGSVTTTVTNLVTRTSTSYSGLWLQIQVPNPVTLNSFSLMGRQDQSLFLYRTPTTFYIAGSNDGSSWELIHSTSGAQFTSATQYFTCNGGNTNKYSYFRLISNVIGNSGTNVHRDYIAITAWDLYTQMNTVNAAVIAVPPYSMTANTTTFAGNSLYDGTYTLTANNIHTHPTIGPIYSIFNDTYGSAGNTWTTGPNYNVSTGAYTGSTSTTVSGVSQSGDWVQLQLPNPIVLYSFSLRFWWDGQSYWAKSFLIAASNDAITWTNIYDTTNASFVYSTAQTFVVTGSPTPYRYFRLIVRATSGVSMCDWWILDQWKLYTNASNFNLTKFPPALLTADSPVTFTTVNQKNWYNVMTYGVTSGSFTPILTQSDPFKQLQLTNGTTSNINNYCNVTGQPVMNYSSFTLSFQLYATNVNNGDYLNLLFGAGGYGVVFAFQILSYQGIRLSTSNVSNAVVSATNWYNSTWNDIRIVYNRSGTNTWTMFFNETQIIQYSDPNWASSLPGSTWGFDAANSTARFDSYIRQLEMTIEPQSLPGNSVVSGSYIASASSFISNYQAIPSLAFNDNIKNTSNILMWHSATAAYTNGAYNTNTYTTTVSGTSYAGEWLQLQAPNPLQLSSFSIYPRQDQSLFQRRSPRNFVMAGSNNGSTWDLLHTATGISDWTAADKYFVCNGSNVANKYSYFRLIVMAVGNPNPGTGDYVNIQNLNLYTPISLNNSVTPATPKGLLDGLTWKYYNGYSSDSVSYYTTNTYTNIGRCIDTSNMTTLTNGQHQVDGADTYSMEIFGYFRATVSGTYTFSLSSDDGSFMWIGSNALVGYTTSNANINNGGFHGVITVTSTVTLLAGTYYPIRIHFSENGGGDDLRFRFTPPGGTQTSNGQGYFFSGTGLDSAFPQESAKIIKDLTGTNKDGVYYILVNGISTPIHCLMNDCYDGGGWMMLMKGTRGTTFQYSANYWTRKNTLNAGDTTRSDADAKYDTFNYSTVKDVLAIWPDIPSRSYTNPYGNNGGSIFVDDGWTWMVNNWNETTRVTPFTGFSTNRLPHQNTLNSLQTYGINNPYRYNGFGGWCYSSVGSYQHVFNFDSSVKVKWGFIFNNESGNLTSCDTFCGIGMGGEANYSAGDLGRAGANWGGQIGINRTARFELYGR
jgi:hypothetical protein